MGVKRQEAKGKRQKWGTAWLVVIIALGAMSAPGLAAQSGPKSAAPTQAADAAVKVTKVPGQVPRYSFHWEGIAVQQGLAQLFGAAGQSYVWPGQTIEGRSPISATMTNVEFKTALDLICQAAYLGADQKDGVWIISEPQQVATVGGRVVPVVGVIATGGGPGSALAAAPGSVPPAPVPARRPVQPVEFPGSETLVDLEVKDVPLSEVVAKLSESVNGALEKQAKARESQMRAANAENAAAKARGIPVGVQFVGRNRIELRAHESVGNVRVTARVYRWPAGQVLGMLIDQAGLVYTSQVDQSTSEVDPTTKGISWQTSSTTIYLVPKPMLKVTGASPAARGGRGES